MMKRLLILTTLVILTVGLTGCQCRNWFRRGSTYSTPPAGATCYDPCQTVDPCDPCQTTVGPEMGGTGTLLPGPGS